MVSALLCTFSGTKSCRRSSFSAKTRGDALAMETSSYMIYTMVPIYTYMVTYIRYFILNMIGVIRKTHDVPWNLMYVIL